jgi:hypothetical protein
MATLDEIKRSIERMRIDQITPIVQKAVGDETALIAPGWTVNTLSVNSIGIDTAGFLRVSGKAKTGGIDTNWSLVVKALNVAESGPETRVSFTSGARELDAFRSGFLEADGHGMTAVRCHQVTELTDAALLWLEDMDGAIPYPWGREEFISAAYQVGQFNGSWPENRAPDEEWFDRDFITNRPSTVVRQDWFSTMIHPDFTTDAAEFTKRADAPSPAVLLHGFNEVVASSLKIPLVVSHNDLHSRNSFMRSESRGQSMYGIDWASIGLSPVGLDGGTLVAGAMIWRYEEASLIADIETEMFARYTSGLTDVGFVHNPDEVRLGWLSNILPYILGFALCGVQPIGYWIPRFGVEGDEFLEQNAVRLRMFMPLFDEAVALARQLG